MDYPLIVSIFFGATTLGTTLWIFFKNREASAKDKLVKDLREYTDSKAALGKIWVEEIKDTQIRDSKYNTQKFTAISDDVADLEKTVKTLQYQQVAKETVEEMLDVRVKPLEASVDKLEGAVERGFRKVEDTLTLQEMNTQNVLLVLARLEGKLEGKGVIGGSKDGN